MKEKHKRRYGYVTLSIAGAWAALALFNILFNGPSAEQLEEIPKWVWPVILLLALNTITNTLILLRWH